VVVDLKSGTEEVVAETAAWGTQVGAHVQWGADDTALFYNDMDKGSWQPFAICIDPVLKTKKVMEGPVYSLSPDGFSAVSPCLIRTANTQKGYGVTVPESYLLKNKSSSSEDGIYITDTVSGRCRLLLSIEDIVRSAVPEIDMTECGQGDFYCMHVKWNSDGSRLMLVLRYLTENGWNPQLITLRPDGSDLS
jgi:hypothetical protein